MPTTRLAFRGGLWRVRFNSDWNGYDASYDNSFSYGTEANGVPMHEMPVSANVGLGKYTALILSQE